MSGRRRSARSISFVRDLERSKAFYPMSSARQ